MCGVVLQTYGAGNGPDTRQDLLHILHEASQRNVLIINITQCYRGSVSGAYAAGKVKGGGPGGMEIVTSEAKRSICILI